MENHIINLNGARIELTDEQFAQMLNSISVNGVKLSDIPVGEAFKIGEYEFIVLENFRDMTAIIHSSSISFKSGLSNIPIGETFKVGDYEFVVLKHFDNGTTAAILKECCTYSAFGKDNNFKGSRVEKICANFAAKVVDCVGADNLIGHTVDLTAPDRTREYGEVKMSYVSPLTVDLYCRYIEVLDKHKLDEPWWLATPVGTDTHDFHRLVRCVLRNSAVSWRDCGDNLGIRPYCIFKSSITVSKQQSH